MIAQDSTNTSKSNNYYSSKSTAVCGDVLSLIAAQVCCCHATAV